MHDMHDIGTMGWGLWGGRGRVTYFVCFLLISLYWHSPFTKFFVRLWSNRFTTIASRQANSRNTKDAATNLPVTAESVRNLRWASFEAVFCCWNNVCMLMVFFFHWWLFHGSIFHEWYIVTNIKALSKRINQTLFCILRSVLDGTQNKWARSAQGVAGLVGRRLCHNVPFAKSRERVYRACEVMTADWTRQ